MSKLIKLTDNSTKGKFLIQADDIATVFPKLGYSTITLLSNYRINYHVVENLDEIMALVNGSSPIEFKVSGSTFQDPEPEEGNFPYKVGDVVKDCNGNILTLAIGLIKTSRGELYFKTKCNSDIYVEAIVEYANKEPLRPYQVGDSVRTKSGNICVLAEGPFSSECNGPWFRTDDGNGLFEDSIEKRLP
jgi:hypothetical protein